MALGFGAEGFQEFKVEGGAFSARMAAWTQTSYCIPHCFARQCRQPVLLLGCDAKFKLLDSITKTKTFARTEDWGGHSQSRSREALTRALQGSSQLKEAEQEID